MRVSKCIHCESKWLERKELTNTGLDESSRWYVEEIRQSAKASSADLQKMIRKMQKGDLAARRNMMLATRKEVVDIAQKYVNRGVHFLELIHLGNEAVYKAMDTFSESIIEAWRIHVKKVVESEMVLSILEAGTDEYEEYHCKDCGYVMRFKK